MKYKQKQLHGVGGCEIEIVGELDDTWCTTHEQYKLACVICGYVFHTSRPHTLYCCNAHRQQAYRDRMNAELTGCA